MGPGKLQSSVKDGFRTVVICLALIPTRLHENVTKVARFHVRHKKSTDPVIFIGDYGFQIDYVG